MLGICFSLVVMVVMVVLEIFSHVLVVGKSPYKLRKFVAKNVEENGMV